MKIFDVDNVVYGLEHLGYDLPEMPVVEEQHSPLELEKDGFTTYVGYDEDGEVTDIGVYPDRSDFDGEVDTEIPPEGTDIIEALGFVNKAGVDTTYDQGTYIIDLDGDLVSDEPIETVKKAHETATTLSEMHEWLS